jgi:hypothetical protein
MENFQWENQPFEDQKRKVVTMDVSLDEDDDKDEFSIDEDYDDPEVDELDY